MTIGNKKLHKVAVAVSAVLLVCSPLTQAQTSSVEQQVETIEMVDNIRAQLPQFDEFETDYKQYSLVDYRNYFGDGSKLSQESNTVYFSTTNYLISTGLSYVKSIGSAGSWGVYYAVDWAGYVAGEAARRAGNQKAAAFFPRGPIVVDDVELGSGGFNNAMEDTLEVTASATLSMVSNFYYENGLDIMAGLASGDFSFLAVRLDGSDSEIAQHMSDALGYSNDDFEPGDPYSCSGITDRYYVKGTWDGVYYNYVAYCDVGENDNYKFARGYFAGPELDLAIVENGGTYVFNTIEEGLSETLTKCNQEPIRIGYFNFEGVEGSCSHDNVVNSKFAKTYSGNDTIVDTDKVEAGEGDDKLFNYLLGYAGEGNDVLTIGNSEVNPQRIVSYAGTGDDVINGGQGADFIDAGPGDDVITEHFSITDDDFEAYRQLTLDETAAKLLDQLEILGQNTERLKREYGAEFKSAMNAEKVAGPINFIDGGDGNDNLRFVVGTHKASRIYIEGSATSSVQQTDFGPYLSSGTYNAESRTYHYDYQLSSQLSDKPLAQITAIEHLTIASKGQAIELQAEVLEIPLNFAGSKEQDRVDSGNGDDFIRTFAGNDRIDSGAGDDIVDAGTGNDNIVTGAGNDLIFPGVGTDTIDGGDGNDILNASNLPYGLKFSLVDNIALPFESQDTTDLPMTYYSIKGIESIIATAHNDEIRGNSVANTLIGGAGNDVIYGYRGSDVIDGGDGDDTLYGGYGKDILKGGTGHDTLYGGKGGDTFVISQISMLGNSTTIQDYSAAQGDMIVLDAQALAITELDSGYLDYGVDTKGNARTLMFDTETRELILASSAEKQVLAKFKNNASVDISEIKFTNLKTFVEHAPANVTTVKLVKKVDEVARQFNFAQTAEPVVVYSAPTSFGKDAGDIYMQNVTPSSVEFSFQEWQYDGHHAKESMDYLIAETGRYEMSDGSVWEFGTLDSNLTHKALNAKFSSEFAATPLVFLSVEANNNSSLSPAVVNQVTPQGFVYTLESNSIEFIQQTDAKVHYIAYLPPVGHSQSSGTLTLSSGALPYQVYRASLGKTAQLIGSNHYYLQSKGGSSVNDVDESVVVLDLGNLSFIQKTSSKNREIMVPRKK